EDSIPITPFRRYLPYRIDGGEGPLPRHSLTGPCLDDAESQQNPDPDTDNRQGLNQTEEDHGFTEKGSANFRLTSNTFDIFAEQKTVTQRCTQSSETNHDTGGENVQIHVHFPPLTLAI